MSIGVGKSGYASPKLLKNRLPHCAICKYFVAGRLCSEKEVVADAKAGHIKLDKNSELAVVEGRGCCNEYEPN